MQPEKTVEQNQLQETIVIENPMWNDIITLSDWQEESINNNQEADEVTKCMEEWVRLSWEHLGFYWEECQKSYIQKNTISREQACQYSDWKYQKYLPVTSKFGNALANEFIVQNNVLYYILHVSEESIPSIEWDRRMFFSQYFCNQWSSIEIYEFATHWVEPYFRLSLLSDTNALLLNIPYEHYGNMPYEWYTLFNTLNASLQRISLWFSQLPSDTNNKYLIMISQQKANEILEETYQLCNDRDYGLWIDNENECSRSYTIDSFNSEKLIFTFRVHNYTTNKLYEKTFQVRPYY